MADDAWAMTGKNLGFEEVEQEGSWPQTAIAWYVTMCILVLVNLALFFAVHCVLLVRGAMSFKSYESLMRTFGFTVLFVFAYRTVFLVASMERYVWHDTFFSSILVIKLMSYLAEQAYVGMIIHATREISHQINGGTGCWWLYTRLCTWFLGLSLIVGQLFSFLGLVKKSHWYLIVRSWCWLLGFASIAPIMCYILLCGCKALRARGGSCCCLPCCCWGPQGFVRPSCLGTGKLFALVMVVFLVLYLPWACFQELPIVNARFAEQYDNDVLDLDFLTGLWDALTFRVQTTDWEVWRHIVWWNTVCATVASWVAIFFSTAPLLPSDDFALIQ